MSDQYKQYKNTSPPEFSTQWLRSFPGYETLSEEEATHLLHSIRLVCALVYACVIQNENECEDDY